MSKIRHSRQYYRSGSIGIGRIFTSPDTALKKDKRPNVTRIGGGNPSMVICPKCDGTVRTTKSGFHNSGSNGRVPSISVGDLLIGSHRFGGGTYSIRRGDVLCIGVGLPVDIKEN